jgi:hypothetical protein
VSWVIFSPLATERTAHDDGLKNSAYRNILGELGDFLIRKLGPWVARIFLEAIDGYEQRDAFGCKRIELQCRRGCTRPRGSDLIGNVRDKAFDWLRIRLVDEVELLCVRFGPGHAHERNRAAAFPALVAPSTSSKVARAASAKI